MHALGARHTARGGGHLRRIASGETLASLPADSWHNHSGMFRGLALSLVLISVGISLPTRTG
jgi:hypothetical protein